ncbi:hypothetical protein [Agromyces sp. LHK192]|uniref:hypothetical protein n=1 Tax=Agromyces sp. LHK192 TaxID=2498704 RepID=UPI000FD7705D|nr:hypothetical protein [Agromyces sp. LHK192]
MHHAADFTVLHQYDSDRLAGELELDARRLADEDAAIDGGPSSRSRRLAWPGRSRRAVVRTARLA